MSDTRFFRCPSCSGVNRIPAAKVDSHPTCGRCKTQLSTEGAVLHLSDDEVERLVQSSPVPVLVDFYADWCGPCRMLTPVMEQLGRAHAGRLFIAKVDTQRHSRLAGRLGVSGIPAVFLYRGGKVVDQAAGFRPLGAWQQMVTPHVAA